MNTNKTLTLLAILSFTTIASSLALGADAVGDDFLRVPPAELVRVSAPRIISIGCGRAAGVEITRLSSLFKNGYSYTCVEIDGSKLERYQIMPNSDINLIAADAANLTELAKHGILPNSFDVAITRHPSIGVDQENYTAFKTIYRKVIPTLLKENGILIVSILSDGEKKYFVKPDDVGFHKQKDTLIFDIQYHLISSWRNEKTTSNLPGINSVLDKYTYYFRNRANAVANAPAGFAIRVDLNENPALQDTISTVNGLTDINGPTPIAKIAPAYIGRMQELFGFEVTSVAMCNAASCLKRGDATEPLKKCGNCSAKYCSKDCQRSDWPIHKSQCKK